MPPRAIPDARAPRQTEAPALYDTPSADTTAILKLKYRASHLGWKSLYPLEGLSLPSACLRDLPRIFAATVAPSERPVVELLRIPIVITTYFRHNFATADGGIRITVDTGLRFHDQRVGSTLRTTFDGTACDFAVVESKLEPAREAEAARMLRALAPRHTRFSKYCHAVGRVARL
ncbi:MAG: VTC domain-containing protein [Gemmatimonadaceae bacterium]